MATGLLSVVMPTRNRPDRLVRAATSILSQTAAAVELVIVDDGSSDDTPEVTNRLAEDRRVVLVRNEESAGPGTARNQGMSAATGDFVGFCDDDDLWMPGTAAAVAQTFAERPELGLVTSWHRVVHDDRERTVDYRGPTTITATDLLWFNFVALPFAVIHRRYLEDLRWDPDLPTGEDWDLWLRCAQQRPVAVIPRPLYSYHQHGGQRVTKEDAGPRVGRQRFLDKHAGEMSSACRAFHAAVVATWTGGRPALARSLRDSARAGAGATLFAASVMTTSYVASAVGVRRHDPGLTARAIHHMLRASPRDRRRRRTG